MFFVQFVLFQATVFCFDPTNLPDLRVLLCSTQATRHLLQREMIGVLLPTTGASQADAILMLFRSSCIAAAVLSLLLYVSPYG